MQHKVRITCLILIENIKHSLDNLNPSDEIDIKIQIENYTSGA